MKGLDIKNFVFQSWQAFGSRGKARTMPNLNFGAKSVSCFGLKMPGISVSRLNLQGLTNIEIIIFSVYAVL
jgi:hypothetical protein